VRSSRNGTTRSHQLCDVIFASALSSYSRLAARKFPSDAHNVDPHPDFRVSSFGVI
jgi:hypothetical protein